MSLFKKIFKKSKENHSKSNKGLMNALSIIHFLYLNSFCISCTLILKFIIYNVFNMKIRYFCE